MATATANKSISKSDLLAELADSTALSKSQVRSVLDSLTEVIRREMGKKGNGVIAIAGLMKITRVHKPAVKARKGKNPFTQEEMTFKAKPARSVVKIRPLKGLKEMV